MRQFLHLRPPTFLTDLPSLTIQHRAQADESLTSLPVLFCTSVTCLIQPFHHVLCLRLSRWGTICMISYFVQLIKTSGRLAPEFLAPWGDDRQLPRRPALLSFLFLRLCLFNVYLIKERQLAVCEERRMKWNNTQRGKKWQMCCRAISSGL